jgi:putative transcriptional regulator
MSMRQVHLFTIFTLFLFNIIKTGISPDRSQMEYATNQVRPTIFLPVQSRNPDDLAIGKLLVASRDLADPLFAKTVILLIQYDSKSAVGLMINKRTDIPLSRVFNQFKEAKDRTDPAYAGGPVEIPTVFALLRSKTKPEDAQQIFEGVYLISTSSQFEKKLSAPSDPAVFRVYLGYAGWTPEQLRQEIKVGAWFIFQGDTETVFSSNPDSLWSRMIRRTELELARSQAFRRGGTEFSDGDDQNFLHWLPSTVLRTPLASCQEDFFRRANGENRAGNGDDYGTRVGNNSRNRRK